jgi:hypothetical protein
MMMPSQAAPNCGAKQYTMMSQMTPTSPRIGKTTCILRIGVYLTRSGPENTVIKDGISRPNSLAFLGADRKNTGHGYQFTGRYSAGQSQTPRPSPECHPSQALQHPDRANLHRLARKGLAHAPRIRLYFVIRGERKVREREGAFASTRGGCAPRMGSGGKVRWT